MMMQKYTITFDRNVSREVLQCADVEIEAPTEAEARELAERMVAEPEQIPWSDYDVQHEEMTGAPYVSEVVPADEDDADDGSLMEDELVELYADAKHWSTRIKAARSMEPEIRRMLRDALRVLTRYAWVRMDEEARNEARAAR
jgi:hypothetical protein